MFFFHDSRRLDLRRPYGAVPAGASLTISAEAALPAGSRVFLRLWQSSETLVPMDDTAEGRYTATLTLPETVGLLWYYFVLETSQGRWYYGKAAGTQGGAGALTQTPPDSWQVTVYQPSALPDWYKNAVAYQIFPDRFHRGADWQQRQADAALPETWVGTKRMVLQDWNDTPFYCKDAAGRVTRWPFFGGTLAGIREKLDYLQSLGVGVIYLNPIFTAPSNHKYDTADYMTIDPAFGDEESFSRLCAEAKQRGIRILLDGVFSHTGDNSLYFNRYGNYPTPGACSEEDSPYDSWYRFDDKYPCGYECWWGVDSLPDVEENDPGYREFICGENGVIRKWLRLGASGWRLDVADELPDSFIQDIRAAALAEKPDALILGEVWEDASNKVSYGQHRQYLLGRELDCTMHYPFRASALDFLLERQDAIQFAEAMETIHENYPASAFYGALTLVGTHDTPRILTVLGQAPEGLTPQEQEEYRLDGPRRHMGLQRLRLLQVLQFTFPGVPCVYYGDEAGMEGFADPYNRGPFPWGREDPWLQLHVRVLSQLRREYPVLREGTFAALAPSPDVFGLRRTLDDTQVQIYVNRSQAPQTIPYPADLGTALDLLSGQVYSGAELTLPALSAVALYREGQQADFSPLPAAARTPTGRGVLCPLFSLPGQGPVGNMADALRFLEVLQERGDRSWMLLPLCPPGDGNSPYSSRCIFAGDPRLIAPNLDVDMDGFDAFCQENRFWLEDYALYTLLRRQFGAPWQQWPWRERDRKNLAALRRRHETELRQLMEEQYRFFRQWDMVREKAKTLGIALIGDLPIYAALDSAETWAHRALFQLDSQGYPTARAGCPPDYFAPEGQDWGNPLYAWDQMALDGYGWWKQRFSQAFRCFDFVRLDHFRAFAAYYAIPASLPPKAGHWMKGPGIAFFREIQKAFGDLPILAEDLGTLDSQVTVLLRHTGLSGMNVWQFSGPEMAAMTPEAAARRVFFSGTHDNQTLAGFLKSSGDERSCREVLTELLAMPAAAVILPVQDLLGLDDSARINVPGVPEGNWTWRMTETNLEDLRKGGVL